MAFNSGDHTGELIDLPGVPGFDPHSGAGPGSVTEPALTNEGPALGSYVDHAAGYLSAQVDYPAREVYAGDSFSGSNDRPVPAAFGAISGGVSVEDQMSTGAGQGRIAENNPSSMWGRGPEIGGQH